MASGVASASAAPRCFAVVVGTTGAGKTKLSVDVCQAIGGEVINADALQMYRGLDVATAKVSDAEAQGVPHHLMSFLEPWETFSVQDFRDKAEAAIDEVLSRGKLPVVVGGTGYYVQALLRDSLLAPAAVGAPGADARAAQRSGKRGRPPELPAGWDSMGPYERLVAVDPASARRLHPANERRVTAAVDAFLRSGVPISEQRRAQAERARLDAESDPSVRGPFVRVLWAHAERSILGRRLDARVGSMLQGGLLQEVAALRRLVRLHGRDPDTGAVAEASGSSPALEADGPSGLFIAIGYKELAAYMGVLEATHREVGDHPMAARAVDDGVIALDSPSEDGWEREDAALREAVRHLQLRTRQYAKEQATWIRKRFRERGVGLVRVDTSDPSRWDELAALPAVESLRPLDVLRREVETGAMPAREVLAEFVVPPDSSTASASAAWLKYRCRICDALLDGPSEWENHLGSSGHRSEVAGLRRRAQRLQAMAEALRAKGLDAASVAARVASVASFHAIRGGKGATDVLKMLQGRLAPDCFDLPWPADDGVAAGSEASSDLTALASLFAAQARDKRARRGASGP